MLFDVHNLATPWPWHAAAAAAVIAMTSSCSYGVDDIIVTDAILWRLNTRHVNFATLACFGTKQTNFGIAKCAR